MTLGPEARGIIEEAAGFDSPSASDKERVRARLAASIGASIVGVAATATAAKGVSAGTTATAMAKGAGGGVLGTTLLAKILAVFAVASAVSVGYVAGRRTDLDATRAIPAATPADRMGIAGPSPTAPASATTPSSESANAAPAEPAEPGATQAPFARPSQSAIPVPHGTAASAPPQPPAAIPAQTAAPAVAGRSQPSSTPEGEGEAALLQRARAAIDAGDGVTALDALDAHERRFPAGLLADQRQAERVVALCTIAKGATTRERAEHFLAQRPRSQQADRIRRACGIP